MKHGFVNTKSHGRVHYLEAREGRVLVLLHSNGASAFQYEQVLPGFAKTWRTLAMVDRSASRSGAIMRAVRSRSSFMWAMREFDAEGALKTLKGPAAVMVGAKGNVVSNLGPYERAVGKERVAVLPDCGHFPMIDDPELFIREVNRLTR